MLCNPIHAICAIRSIRALVFAALMLHAILKRFGSFQRRASQAYDTGTVGGRRIVIGMAATLADLAGLRHPFSCREADAPMRAHDCDKVECL
jgi:hypothetical protein